MKRPHVDEFLEKMAELFECVLFTASLGKVRPHDLMTCALMSSATTTIAFGALTLLVGWHEVHPACKTMGEVGGGWHWLVRMEWCPAGWLVCQKFSCGTGSPGLARKKCHKTVLCVCVCVFCNNTQQLG